MKEKRALSVKVRSLQGLSIQGRLSMLEPLRICLFDAEQLPGAQFRDPFEHLKNIFISGETGAMG